MSRGEVSCEGDGEREGVEEVVRREAEDRKARCETGMRETGLGRL